MSTKTVKILSGGGFVTKETRAETMCELREEEGINSNASAAVGGVNVNNSYQLQEGDIIAFVSNDKTGGQLSLVIHPHLHSSSGR
tara:strand:+ start:7515 stop:7769 length:255 start_codon:yes stop_codon:yes gene_type:complete